MIYQQKPVLNAQQKPSQEYAEREADLPATFDGLIPQGNYQFSINHPEILEIKKHLFFGILEVI